MPGRTLGEVQRSLLDAVLGNTSSLPVDRDIALPDVSFVLGHQPVVVADENLLEPERLEALSRPVEIQRLNAIRQRAQVEGNIAYLRFEPVERRDDTVCLTLKAEIAPRDPDQGLLGLSGVRICFREAADEWEAIGEPTYFAA